MERNEQLNSSTLLRTAQPHKDVFGFFFNCCGLSCLFFWGGFHRLPETTREILSCRVSQVMEQRHAESHAVLLDESRAASEQGSSVHHVEPNRRSGGVQQEGGGFSLNLSFEELSGAGLEEPPRHSNNSQWQVRLPPSSVETQHHASLYTHKQTEGRC